jgi:hypothetical protein
MQEELRHEIVRTVMHVQPVDSLVTERAIETELTMAARGSVDNAGQIVAAENYEETDFTPQQDEQVKEAREKAQRRKSRKAERQRKKKSKNKKRK